MPMLLRTAGRAVAGLGRSSLGGARFGAGRSIRFHSTSCGCPRSTSPASPENWPYVDTDINASELLKANDGWAERVEADTPTFFSDLAKQQTPDYLWIGCSDSRVPANQVCDLPPGEVFVHRNIANVVVSSDLNCLSVMQYAIDHLKVKHVIVSGHYGCGGVKAALSDSENNGLVDNWLDHVRNVRIFHLEAMDQVTVAAQERIEAAEKATGEAIAKDKKDELVFNSRWDLLCGLNVMAQVRNVSRTTVVRECWSREQPLAIHGWIYGLNDGRLRSLFCNTTSADNLEAWRDLSVARAGELAMARLKGQLEELGQKQE